MGRALTMPPVLALAFGAALICACVSPRVAYNRHADFGQVQRVAIVTFGGPQGDVAADMLAQSLVMKGANVIERQQLDSVLHEQHLASTGFLDPATVKAVGKILGVDALFVGTVVQSMPAQSYMVQSPRHAVVGSVTPLGSSADLSSEGPVLGVPGSQVVTSAAQVSLVARMVDVETGTIMWSASEQYEGFDVASAMQSITDAFAASLVPIWPQLVTKG